MSSFRVRPRFEQTIESPPEATRDRLLSALADQAPSFEVKAFPGYIVLRVPPGERTFWSPRLTLSLEPAGAATRVEGIYGPNADLWSLFLFGYLITGSLALFSGILGFAQRVIGASPWGLYACGGMLVAVLLLYLFAQLGQKLGAWQTFQLHQAYQAAIGQPTAMR